MNTGHTLPPEVGGRGWAEQGISCGIQMPSQAGTSDPWFEDPSGRILSSYKDHESPSSRGQDTDPTLSGPQPQGSSSWSLCTLLVPPNFQVWSTEEL